MTSAQKKTKPLQFSPQVKCGLRKVKAYMLEEPGRVRMDIWWWQVEPGTDLSLYVAGCKHRVPSCGTVGCIGGTFEFLVGGSWQDIIPIGSLQAKAFERCCYHWRQSWPLDVLDRLNSAGNPLQYTQAVVEAIDLLITNPAVFLLDRA